MIRTVYIENLVEMLDVVENYVDLVSLNIKDVVQRKNTIEREIQPQSLKEK